MSEKRNTHKTVLEKNMAVFIKILLKSRGIKGKVLKAKSGYGIGALYDVNKHISSRMFKTYVETIIKLSGALTEEEGEKAQTLYNKRAEQERNNLIKSKAKETENV